MQYSLHPKHKFGLDDPPTYPEFEAAGEAELLYDPDAAKPRALQDVNQCAPVGGVDRYSEFRKVEEVLSWSQSIGCRFRFRFRELLAEKLHQFNTFAIVGTSKT